ncbi:hypothetical protein ACIO87_38305 [Streptomyces sp. NPDC087218]|uniref:hypothetical protein n=1 Tax=Streptomyces sp. NPDC087218 TaxID=3365769 RepID=UPI00380C67E6
MRRRIGRTAAAGAVAVALFSSFGCQVSSVSKEGPLDGRGGNSSFSPAGAEKIVSTRKAHLDWSSGHLLKSDVGLASADDSATWASTHDRQHPIAVTIDAPHGSVALRADDIAVEDYPGDPEIRSVALRLHPRDNDALVAELRAGVTLYGLEGDAVESWISSFADDPQRTCTRLGWSTRPGTSTGLDVGYTIQCDWDGPEQIRLVLVDVGPS